MSGRVRPRRDTCRICRRRSATYQDGTIYVHRTKDRTATCPGSRKPPKRVFIEDPDHG